METPGKYKLTPQSCGFNTECYQNNEEVPEVSSPIYFVDRREQILTSNYFYQVSQTANNLILSGLYSLEDDELIDDAIAFTDKLIERVEEKI